MSKPDLDPRNNSELSKRAKYLHKEKGVRKVEHLPKEMRPHFKEVLSHTGKPSFILADADYNFKRAQRISELYKEDNLTAADVLHQEANEDNVKINNNISHARAQRANHALKWISTHVTLSETAQKNVNKSLDIISDFFKKLGDTRYWAIRPEPTIELALDQSILERSDKAIPLIEEYQSIQERHNRIKKDIAESKAILLLIDWEKEYRMGGAPFAGKSSKSKGMSLEKYVAMRAGAYTKEHEATLTDEDKYQIRVVSVYLRTPLRTALILESLKKSETDLAEFQTKIERMESIKSEIKSLFEAKP
jgi:hypothetical protein